MSRKFAAVAVDANVLLSASLSIKHTAHQVLQFGTERYITTQFNMDEAADWIPKLALKPKYQRAGITKEEMTISLNTLPIEIFDRYTYKNQVVEAEKRIGHRDPKDIDLVALALKFDAVIWTNDGHFSECGIRVLATGEMFQEVSR